MSMLIITELKISGWFLLSSLWFFWISHSTPDPTPTSPWPSSEQCPPGQWRGRGVGGASPDSDPDTETGLAAGGCRGGNTCCSGSHRVTLPIQSISKVLWLSGHLLLSKPREITGSSQRKKPRPERSQDLPRVTKGRTPAAPTLGQAGFRQWPQGPRYERRG